MLFLENEFLCLMLAEKGAEWQSLVDKQLGSRERLWQGDAAWWGRRSPLLFPIVGRLRDDAFWHQGRRYTMPQHGFARDKIFQTLKADQSHCVQRLVSSEANYPFNYALTVATTLHKNTVLTQYEIANRGRETLYASIGAHPAFALEKGADYRIQINAADLAQIRM